MMKHAFYFMIKAIFVREILTFWLDFLGMYKNCLIRKLRLISKFMTSQTANNYNTYIAQYLKK